MSAWWRRINDRCVNIGLSLVELSRRCHGQTDRRDVVELAVALEETLRIDVPVHSVEDGPTAGEIADRAMKLFQAKRRGQ